MPPLLRSWQVIIIAVILTGAYFLDMRLFIILAALAATSGLLAFLHLRGRAHDTQGALFARVQETLGVDEGAATAEIQSGSSHPTLVVQHDGMPVQLSVTSATRDDGAVTALLWIRAPIPQRVPLCFVAHRRDHSPISLPSLVSNSAIAAAQLECELASVPLTDGALSNPGFDVAGSGGGAVQAVLAVETVDRALAELQRLPNAVLVALEFDGTRVGIALHPPVDEPADPWLPPAIATLSALSQALSDALYQLAAGTLPMGPAVLPRKAH